MAITENHSTLPPKPESRSADSRSISKYIAMLILDIVLRIYSPANVADDRTALAGPVGLLVGILHCSVEEK